jgi:addiction module HigA family antidote
MAKREYPAVGPNRPPMHPGELLREIVEEHLHLSISEAARQLGISRQMLHKVLNGAAAVTPDMALRFGKLFGKDPGLWLQLQQAYDLWHGERRLADELAKIKTHEAA